jgi:outer membrane protein with beta-barrel domain
MRPHLPILIFLLTTPFLSFSQIGIKAGVNFANVTKASNINADNSTGFHAGIFYGTQGKSILGFRSELVYSKQGYDFKTNSTTGSVKLDYLLLPQLMEINITKFVAIQAGFQMAFLLSAKADSTSAPSTGNAQVDDMLELYNRFDYGAAGGVEVHPIAGLVVGARINISFADMYKEPDPTQPPPNFYPEVNAKNNVFQLYAGYRF